MRQLHAIWLLVTVGITSLVDVGNMIIDGTKIKFRSAPGPAGVRTVLDDSDIVSSLAGNQTDKVPSAAAVKTAVDGAALTVNPNSSSYVVINNGQLEIKPLLVTRPVIDPASISLVAALAARTPVYNLANVGNTSADLQAGDSLILPLHTGGLRVFMHNGGALGTIADFTLVEQPALDAATVRALLTATNGLTYNNVTGQFKLGGALTEPTDFYLGVATPLSVIAGSVSLTVSTNIAGFTHNTGAGVFVSANGLGIDIKSGASNGAILTDFRSVPKGLEVNFTNYAGLTANSYAPKGYVDAQILASSLGKANVTLNTTAGAWTTVAHNFALTAGNFDCLIVTMFDSSGVGVTAPFRVKNANEIEVLTAEAVTGLKVRMLKTL